MSFGPPSVPPAPPVPPGVPGVPGVPGMPGMPGVPPRTTPGGLLAIGILLIGDLLTNLGVLGYDIDQKGIGYIPTALGFSYSHFVDAPVGFFGYQTAFCVAVIALAIGAFSGGGWVRPAAVVLLATDGYDSAASLINQLGASESRNSIVTPFSNLLLNLTQVYAMLAAVVVVLIVVATRKPAPRPQPYPAYAYAPPLDRPPFQ